MFQILNIQKGDPCRTRWHHLVYPAIYSVKMNYCINKLLCKNIDIISVKLNYLLNNKYLNLLTL